MRILMISDHSDPLVPLGSKEAGGQNAYVYYLSRFLGRLGVDIDIYTRWNQANKRPVVQVSDHVRVIRIAAGPKEFLPKEKFLNVIDEFTKNIYNTVKLNHLRYDIIHTNYWYSGLAGLRLSQLLNLRPLVHVYHSIGKVRLDVLKHFPLQQSDKAFLRKRLAAEELIATKSQGIIATSPVEKRLVQKFYHVKDKIKVIPIGVDQTIFYPVDYTRTRKQLAWPMNQHIILYVGRLDWRKGIDTLLHALYAIVKVRPEYHLYIIGGEQATQASLHVGEQHRLQTTLVQLKLQKHVHFLGPKQQQELRYYYSAADVVVVPSYYEPFGIVALEAMACGTPVVASHTGGLTYTIADKVTGYLAEPMNPKDFARKIRLVLQQGKHKFSNHCVQRIHEEFAWKDVAQDYVKYFNRLVKHV